MQTSPAQVHGAKVLQNLRMCKKNCILVRFFWCGVYGVECKGRNLLGEKSPSTKPVVGIKHVHEWARSAQLLVNYLRILGNLFRIPVNLFRKAILRNSTFCDKKLMRSSLGRLSVFARCFEARYKKGERDDNINKTHFFQFAILRSFLGLSLVLPWSLARGIYIRY